MTRAGLLRSLATGLTVCAGFLTGLAGTSGSASAAVITFDDLGVPAGRRVTVNVRPVAPLVAASILP